MSIENCYVCDYCSDVFRIFEKHEYIHHLRQHAIERIYLKHEKEQIRKNTVFYEKISNMKFKDVIPCLLNQNILDIRNIIVEKNNFGFHFNSIPSLSFYGNNDDKIEIIDIIKIISTNSYVCAYVSIKQFSRICELELRKQNRRFCIRVMEVNDENMLIKLYIDHNLFPKDSVLYKDCEKYILKEKMKSD